MINVNPLRNLLLDNGNKVKVPPKKQKSMGKTKKRFKDAKCLQKDNSWNNNNSVNNFLPHREKKEQVQPKK